MLSLIVAPLPSLIIPHLTYVPTDSIKYRLLWSSDVDNKKFRQNIYVRLLSNKIDNRKLYLVKKIGCLSGSYLERRGREFYCDGKKICRGVLGKELFFFAGVIPEGKYFMIGDHPRSYDSRSLGFFEENEIDAILTPLF